MNDTPGKMLSSLTGGGDKQQPKLGGCVGVFFQLFDWNRRITGKKLFSNRLLPAERTKKQVSKKYHDEKLPMAKLLLIADENRGGFPHAKKSSGSVCSSTEDPCCSSSEDGNANGMRAPGVVARLMGLESLPANDLPEHGKEYQAKPSEPRPLPELLNQRRHADFFHEAQVDRFTTKKPHAKPNGPAKKPVETRPWKLQKTGLFEKRPISRFQADTLPVKSILSPSKTHGKLVSPSKSPRILSAKNAARLIEAAAKILEPGMQTSNRGKNPLIRSSVARPLLKYQEGDDKNTYIKRSSRLSEAQKKNGGSNTIKSLKGQVLSKSWNGNEDTDCLRSSIEQSSSTFAPSAQEQCGTSVQDTGKRKSKVPIASIKQEGSGATRAQSKLETSKATHVKKQEKTISLALEAKANVQRREIEPGAASSNRSHSVRDKNTFKQFQDESKQQSERQDSGHKLQPKQSVSGITRASKHSPSAPNDRQSNQLLSQEKGVLKTNRGHQKTSKASSGESFSKSIQRNPLGAKDFVASNRNVSANQRNNNYNRVSGLRKDGCKDRECRMKSEEKKSDSSVEAKALPRKKRASDGHFPRENTCFVESASVDEGKVLSGKNEKKGCSKSVEEVVSYGKGSTAIQSKQECLKIAENYREGNKWTQWDNQKDSQSCSKSIDVVSFTFSSPMRSTGGFQTGIHVTEKKQGPGPGPALDDWRERQNARWRDPPLDCEPEKIISEVTCASPSSLSSTVSGGDSLNALLECKLRELASVGGVDLGTGSSSKDSIAGKTTASILQDLILALNTGRPLQMAQKMSTGHSHLEKAGEADLTSERSSEFPQTVGENKKFEAGGFSGSGHVPSRGRIIRTVMEDSGGTAGPVCAEDCDQPSPVSILEASFSNESSNSSESLDGAAHDDKLQLLCSSVQSKAGRVHPADGHQGLDGSAELSDSASSANMELVESDKIMGAILNISRMHRIDPSSIGLTETKPVCLEDQELEYVREIVCNAKLMSQDVALVNEDEAADVLLDPNLFDRLEAQGRSTDDYSLHIVKNNCYSLAFRKAQGSWQNRKLLFDCVKECINSKYGSVYRRGYIAWAKGSTFVVREQLAREVYEEIVRWRNLAFGMLDEIVEKDMSTPMGKWTDFELEMFEIGVEIEKNVFQFLIEEVAYDLLPDTACAQRLNGLAMK